MKKGILFVKLNVNQPHGCLLFTSTTQNLSQWMYCQSAFCNGANEMSHSFSTFLKAVLWSHIAERLCNGKTGTLWSLKESWTHPEGELQVFSPPHFHAHVIRSQMLKVGFAHSE